VVRIDAAIGGIPNDGCSGPPPGNNAAPVFQPMWVIDPTGNWVEEGSSHNCQDTNDYWYWGYGTAAGQFVWVGTRSLGSSGGSHRFFIYRDTSATWSVNVDATQVGSFMWNFFGSEVQVGLESYIRVRAYQQTYSNG